jgi:hypothetical protein
MASAKISVVHIPIKAAQCSMTQFDYEISLDEYSAAQALYYKACTKRQAFTKPLGWAFVGLLLLSVAILQWVADWTHFLLLLTGAWFTYGAITSLPKRLVRKFYLASGLAGRKYRVELDGGGFTVNSDGCTWRVQ